MILEYKPECITEAFNNNIKTKKMPNDWKKSTMVRIFKGNGDVLECNNYRGTQLISHAMKLWEIMFKMVLYFVNCVMLFFDDSSGTR